MATERKLVFISHANPEDNEFTLWLASRLVSLGYTVWSDVTKLFGAELFWDDIEDAIRHHAAKVVVVLSRVSQQKQGVLDEVNVAVTVERSQRIREFVVPVRIDDLPFSEVRANLARKNIIDFTPGWAGGFAQLLKVLERDGVPRQSSLTNREMSAWVGRIVAGDQQVVETPHPVTSNWLELTEWPQTLRFFSHRIGAADLKGRLKPLGYAWSEYRGLIVTFASQSDIEDCLSEGVEVDLVHEVCVPSVLRDELGESKDLPSRPVMLGTLSWLLRTSWDMAMRTRGLRPYEMSNERMAWFAANDAQSGNWVSFIDMAGVRRRKRLVGRSVRRSVNWHYAIEVSHYASIGSLVIAKPHIVFTRDGMNPLDDPKAMHRLRRGFCKSWWNDRWRDLLLAYLTSISGGFDQIEIPCGGDQAFRIAARPLLFESPVSVSGLEEVSEEDDSDSQLDSLAEQDVWDAEEAFADDEGSEAATPSGDSAIAEG